MLHADWRLAMANLADTAAGRVTAETLCKTRMAAGDWVVAHMAVDKSGHTIVRFQRFRSSDSAATMEYGGWTTSRADDAL